MWHDMTGTDWAWMVFGMAIFWLLLLAIGVGVICALIDGRPGGASRDVLRAEARALLDELLARGELDVEEYEARRRAL